MSTGATFESFEKELNQLAGTFERNLAEFKSPGYVEAQLRDDFLNPFFRALGWDLENRAGLIQTEREVEIESRTQISQRAAFRAWRESLPTPLERDTLLWPEVIAESVVAEASRYLRAELPADFPSRLAAKAYHLYPRHRQFHKMLNRPGNRGRDNLYVYMRHWTASWLKRERRALFKRMPWEYSLGRPLKTETELVTL